MGFLLLWGGFVVGVADGPGRAYADEAIYRRIDQLRQAASRILVDGLDRDWVAIPQMTDPRDDAMDDGSRDIVAVAIAPTKKDLCIMVRTAQRPSTERWAFYLDLDLWGGVGDDVRIETDPSRRGTLVRFYGARQELTDPVSLRGMTLIVRRAIEIRINYRDLLAARPPEIAKLPGSGQMGPWVRMRTLSWNAQERRIVDIGPAVASFRLLETPYPLDPPLPKRPRSPLPIGLPVRGQWFLLQGPFGSRTHPDIWAYDLVKLGRDGHESNPPSSKKNEDYLAWGQPVYSPVEGRVIRARSDAEDSPAQGTPRPKAPTNEVYMSLGGGLGLGMIHLRKGSVDARPGEKIIPGRQVGLVGNSGESFAPHLHLAIWGGYRTRQTMPIVLRNVRVGLNPVKNDPWVRELPEWEPREGYFVEQVGRP